MQARRMCAARSFRLSVRHDQIPPMYSALKVNGPKLCDLARKDRLGESRRITIHSIEIEDIHCLA